MSRSQGKGFAGAAVQSAVRGFRWVKDTVRAKITAVDIWIQDHYRFVVTGVLLTLGAATGWLLWWRWEEAIGFAKQVAPVFTIVSIIASALLSVLAWFRKRRLKRLAAQAAARSPQLDHRSEG
ncbi:hypothetical protein GCM10010350_71520 [Streptomyces galilaeus]|nr:hypothetical protein GCM10010350_71520 [Streptomyces galilaeus]